MGCNCLTPRIGIEEAHAHIEKYMEGLELDDDFIDLYKSTLKDVFSMGNERTVVELKEVNKKIVAIEQRLSSIENKFFDGEVGADVYVDAKNRNTNSVFELKSKRRELESLVEGVESFVSFGLLYSSNLGKLVSSASDEIKQKMVGSIFPENFYFENGKTRTASVNSFIDSMLNINKGFNGNKKGKITKSSNFPFKAPPQGLEPWTL